MVYIVYVYCAQLLLSVYFEAHFTIYFEIILKMECKYIVNTLYVDFTTRSFSVIMTVKIVSLNYFYERILWSA